MTTTTSAGLTSSGTEGGWIKTVDQEAGADFKGLPSAGTKRRIVGLVLGILNTMFLGLAIADGSLFAATNLFWAVVGWGTFAWGLRSRKARRAAIAHRVNSAILRLARDSGGRLTVTNVAAGLDISLGAAEATLNAMEDGLRVRSEISSQGVIYYEFADLIHGKEMVPLLEESSGGQQEGRRR